MKLLPIDEQVIASLVDLGGRAPKERLYRHAQIASMVWSVTRVSSVFFHRSVCRLLAAGEIIAEGGDIRFKNEEDEPETGHDDPLRDPEKEP